MNLFRPKNKLGCASSAGSGRKRGERGGGWWEPAEENEAKAVERYNEGKVSVVEVIDAQTYRQTSQVNYVQAKAAAQGHYSELIKALHGYDYQ